MKRIEERKKKKRQGKKANFYATTDHVSFKELKKMGAARQGVMTRKKTVIHGLIKPPPPTAEEIVIISITFKDICSHM